VILSVSSYHRNELGYFKVRAEGADLRLPSYLNDGTSTIHRLIGVPGGSIGGHCVEVGVRQILSHILREVLWSRNRTCHRITDCHPARLGVFLIRLWNIRVKFSCFGRSQERGIYHTSSNIVQSYGELHWYDRVSHPPIGEVLECASNGAVLVRGSASKRIS